MPTPACPGPTGSPEATFRAWDGEQSRRFTSPPTRADFLLGVFAIFPKAASHGAKPSRNTHGAGRGCWGRRWPPRLLVHPAELLPPRSPATKRGMHRPAPAPEPCWEAQLSLGTSGFRSIPSERLRFASPCEWGANLLSNSGVKTAGPGLSCGRAG